MEILALSSGESELGGLVRACTEGLGMKSLLLDFNIKVDIVIKSDATAAIGMAKRQGLGRVRHLATSDLWIQQRLRQGDFSIQKHPGISNSADFMTKVKSRPDILKFLGLMGFMVGTGRPASAPVRFKWTVDSPVKAPCSQDLPVDLPVMDCTSGVGCNVDGDFDSGCRIMSVVLDGRNLIPSRSLPSKEHRTLMQVFNVNSGEIVYHLPTDSQPPQQEPDLFQWADPTLGHT